MAEDVSSPRIRNYYVDEAGDGTLFNRRKQVVVGKEGCSKYFVLGLLDAADPERLDGEISVLRKSLLEDPYLKNIPSIQPEAKKTAIAFHAKDDCPEVRREVFKLLMTHDLKFFAVIRDKLAILDKVREHNKRVPDYRYHPNQLYDRCISRLFRDRLHKDGGYSIHFAKRGTRSRTKALKNSLERARNNFRRKYGISMTTPIEVIPTTPSKVSGLQAADYFLWALQRLYERGEDRYWEYVASSVGLVHDVDDTRNDEYGKYYTKKNPLSAACIRKKPGI